MLKESTTGHFFIDTDLKRPFLLFLLEAVDVNMLFPQCILSLD